MTDLIDPICPEKETVYFNRRFFDDIVRSPDWKKIRENQETQ